MNSGEQERALIGMEHPRCPYCHEDVRPGDDEAKQSCGSCMAWHHAECWQDHGGCSACNQKDTESTRLTRAAEPTTITASKAKAPLEPLTPAATPSLRRGALVIVALCFAALVGTYRVLAPATPVGGEPFAAEAPASPAWKLALAAATTEEQRTAAVREGAEAGDPGAMNQYGFRLMTGTGCEPNVEEAAVWGRRAAEAGHAEAMFGLAMLYEQGRGVARDEEGCDERVAEVASLKASVADAEAAGAQKDTRMTPCIG
jgi:TPR repeat protein